jgi:hypothetical protein
MEKRIVYAEIPAGFDQETQYVVQLLPVETDETIYYGIEIRDLETEESEEEHTGA